MFVFPCNFRCPKRYLTVIVAAIGMCIVHAQRVNIGVTVITILDENPKTKVSKGPAQNLPGVSWSPLQIGVLHSMFFVGYILTQIPGGYLATKLPPHRLFGGSVLMTCGFNMFIPVAIVHSGFVFTCLVRFMQGMSEGFLFPSCYAILWHWTTPAERSRLGALVLGGVYAGAVLGLPLSGAITNYMRWDLVYYFFGIVGLVWVVVWVSIAYKSPEEHPSITQKELEYIRDQQKETNTLYQDAPIPWASIVTSLPVQAICVCHFARSFVLFLLVTNEPAYLNVFGYGIATNGALSALPHLGKAIVALGSGPVADHCLTFPQLTPTHVRKIFTCVGFGVQCLCYFSLVFLDTGTVCVTLLAIGTTVSGLTVSGWNINHLDLAPRYASVLVAISTSIGTVAGIIMPLIVGKLTSHQVIGEWQNVFLLTSGILAFAVVFYGIFGSAKKQKWADPPPPEVRVLLEKTDPTRGRMYQAILQTQRSNEANHLEDKAEVSEGVELPPVSQTGDGGAESGELVSREESPDLDADAKREPTGGGMDLAHVDIANVNNASDLFKNRNSCDSSDYSDSEVLPHNDKVR